MIKYDRWVGNGDGLPVFWVKNLLRLFGWTVRLHKFVKADAPGCFHTHPALAIRIILWGGYVEELGDGTWKTWWPGRIGIVRPELEHRIDRLRNGRASYSMWIRGPLIEKVTTRGC